MPTIDFSKYKVAPSNPALNPAQNGGTQSPQIDFSKYKTTSGNPVLPPAPPVAQGLTGALKTDFNKRVNSAADVLNSKQSGVSKFVQDVGQGAGMVSDTVSDVAAAAGRKIPVANDPDAIDYAAPALPQLKVDSSTGGSPTLTDVFIAMMKSAGSTAPAQFIAQKANEFSQKHPEAAGDLGALFNIASIIPEGGAADAIGEGAVNAGKKGVDAIANAPKAVEDAKIAASSGSRIPTLDSSASRIGDKSALPKSKVAGSSGTEGKDLTIPIKQGIGKSKLEDPAALHTKYYNQEKKALSDTKEDTALGMVGSDLGKAFDNVVKTRSKAGATMEKELEKVGGIKTDISSAKDSLVSNLNKVGLKFNADKNTLSKISRKVETSMTSSDRNLVKKYMTDLKKLGPNPTVKNLDSFLKRVPDDIKVYKAKNAITGTTNGERMVKNNLAELRKQFDPKVSGKELAKYSAARSQYSDLSKFMDEGIPFLGKKTSTGDFAKDASLVKSSVQSALNGGKKDWLMKLERLTGNPIIDKATLALQAMKDAGDYRGNSLLDLLSEGNAKVPTSPHGLVDKAAGMAIAGTKRAALGSPYEQTQRFLKSLRRTPKRAK